MIFFALAALSLRLELDAARTLTVGGRPVIRNVPDKLSVSEDGGAGGVFLRAEFAREAAAHTIQLGTLECSRLLACARATRYWMAPAFGTRAGDVPLDTQLLLLELAPDAYAVVLPLIDHAFRASVHGGRGDALRLHAESGDREVCAGGMTALYVAGGADPFALVRSAVEEVAGRLRTFRPLSQKELPPSVDTFGWCTWDAFYSKVTPAGVLRGLGALHAAGVPPRTLILDDGWQSVTPPAADATTAPPAAAPPAAAPSAAAAVRAAGARAVAVVRAALAAAAAALLGALTAAMSAFYDRCVARAAHGAPASRLWGALARTVLKGQLWGYFEGETDFGRQLEAFEPNAKFSAPAAAAAAEGGEASPLKELVAEARRAYDVKHVYAWHALHGYWRGASAELGAAEGVAVVQAAPVPSKHQLKVEPQLGWDPMTLFGAGVVADDGASLDKFYGKLHGTLAAAGIDGVKVDVQAAVGCIGGGGGGGGVALVRRYTRAMEASVQQKFAANDCINCMCHSTENLYSYESTAVARASDDFYPTRPESHTAHLVNVAYNSILIGEICLPDWDMFHSLHEVGALHAAARAVGGCAVYVSDAPGRHDVALLRRLVLPDGSTLRARLPGRPTRDCLFADVSADGSSALKVWNANACGAVVGAFHVQGVAWVHASHGNEVLDAAPPPLTATVRPADAETLRGAAGPFAAWRHRAARVELLDTADAAMEVKLNHREWEIFTIVPVETVGGVRWAPFGLADMMNTGGALAATELRDLGGGRVAATATSRGPGRFVAHCAPAPARVVLERDGAAGEEVVPFRYVAESGQLTFDLGRSTTALRVEWS